MHSYVITIDFTDAGHRQLVRVASAMKEAPTDFIVAKLQRPFEFFDSNITVENYSNDDERQDDQL